jgi:hypothetical protein
MHGRPVAPPVHIPQPHLPATLSGGVSLPVYRPLLLPTPVPASWAAHPLFVPPIHGGFRGEIIGYGSPGHALGVSPYAAGSPSSALSRYLTSPQLARALAIDGRHALWDWLREREELERRNAAALTYVNPYLVYGAWYGFGGFRLSPDSETEAPGQPVSPGTVEKMLTTSGIDNEGGRVKWPPGLFVLASPEAEQQRQRIEVLLHALAARAQAGQVDPRIGVDLALTVEQLREQLRARAERGMLAQGTVQEAERFLDQLKKAPRLPLFSSPKNVAP